MDPVTLIGIVFGGGMILAGALLEGGHIEGFIGETAFIIVVGGTIGATMACFSGRDLKSLFPSTTVAFKKPSVSLTDIFEIFGELAVLARREGILVLENHPIPVNSELLKRGVHLVVDGTDPNLLKDMLTTQLATNEMRSKTMASIWSTAGGFAPTIGIIGTVLGLVHVLSNLSEPDKLGGAIAVAFLATLYGVGSANLIYYPIAKKMNHVGKTETQIGLVIIEGLVSIQSGDNPRVVQEKLKCYIEEQEWPALEAQAQAKQAAAPAARGA